MTDGGGGAPADPAAVEQRKATEADLEEVAVASFNDAQEVWARALPDRYRPTTLVLFWDGTRSGCGDASSAMGPFYCPLDQKVYIDMSFYDDLSQRFGAPGDFAQAYVIAHEVGHHVQNLVGTAKQVHEAQQQAGRVQANELSVRMELQADCFAGVWANHASRSRQLLEAGDVEEGLNAASAIGDDRMQRETQGRVVPDAFTHGSSEQRVRWFRKGLEAGTPEACDTFNAKAL